MILKQQCKHVKHKTLLSGSPKAAAVTLFDQSLIKIQSCFSKK